MSREMDKDTTQSTLLKILEGMDIPPYRVVVNSKSALEWLKKNLGTRNSESAMYARAVQYIGECLENRWYDK